MAEAEEYNSSGRVPYQETDCSNGGLSLLLSLMQYLFQFFTVEAYNVLVANSHSGNCHLARVRHHIIARFFIGCYV